MVDHGVESSPHLYARIGGALYLVIIVLGIFSEAFVRGRLIVPGDAAATAASIMSMESLWRVGIADAVTQSPVPLPEGRVTLSQSLLTPAARSGSA